MLQRARASGLSRRTLLRAAGGIFLSPRAIGVLASCIGGEYLTSVGVGAASAAAAIKPGGVLNVAIGTDISSLEPQVTTETSSGGVRCNIYDMLIWDYTRNGSTVPMLASKWEVSRDGLEYTFTLTD